MKGPWRFIILFMLPGALLAGGMLTAAERGGEQCGDVLAVLLLLGMWGTFFAALGAWGGRCFLRRGGDYYGGVMVMGVLLALWAVAGTPAVEESVTALLPVWSRWSGLLLGVPVRLALAALPPGLMCGWLTVALWNARGVTARDRFAFGAGALLLTAGMMLGTYTTLLPLLETLRHWMVAAWAGAWLFASPPVMRGARRRGVAALLLLGILAVVMMTVPYFLGPPRGELAAELGADYRWNHTELDPEGKRYFFQSRRCNDVVVKGDGTAVAQMPEDAELSASVLPALLTTAGGMPRVLFIGSPFSEWPEVAEASAIYATLDWLPVPEWASGMSFASRHRLVDGVRAGGNAPYDLVALFALPEAAYRVVTAHFLKTTAAMLAPDGVLIVPEWLLAEPSVFRFMHGNFNFSGRLPGAAVWAFSRRRLELEPGRLDAVMTARYGEDAPMPSGVFAMLFPHFTERVESERVLVLPAFDHDWRGAGRGWGYWLLGIVAGVFVWRALRLPWERKSGRYAILNGVENGFSALWPVWAALWIGRTGMGMDAMVLGGLPALGVLMLGTGGGRNGVGGRFPLLLLGLAFYGVLYGVARSETAGAVEAALVLTAGVVIHYYAAGGVLARRLAGVPELRGAILIGFFLGMLAATVVFTGFLMLDAMLWAVLATGVLVRLPELWRR